MNVTLVDADTGERVTVPTDWLGYGTHLWRTLPDGVEMTLNDLDPHLLRVDHEYQRGLSKRRVHEYAQGWDEKRAFALTVSFRGQGDYVVIDGQHRMAAALEAGVERVPCLILAGLTRQAEAKLFADLSMARVALGPRDRFKARLVAGDPTCAAIMQAVTECGFTIDLAQTNSKAPDLIQAVGALEHIYSRGLTLRPYFKQHEPIDPPEGMAAVRRALHTIAACWPHQRDAKQWDMLVGTHDFWVYYADLVSLEALAEKLRLTTATEIVRTAQARRETMGGSRPLWVAHAMVEHYNKSKRSNRLPARLPQPGTSAGEEV